MARLKRRRGRRDEEELWEATLRPASAMPERSDDATDRLLREAGPEPERIAERLRAADPGTQTRALERLQRGHGNGFVQGVIRALVAGRHGGASGAGVGAGLTRTTGITLERSVGDGASRLAIQREDGDELPEGAEELSEPTGGATEVIGPPASSSYPVTGVTLTEVATQIGARPEAGHVGWALDMSYTAPKGPIETVTVSALITLEMPSWTPPTTMLPRARAEWNRWYAALLAHEQGHIDLIHTHFDGLAASILGKSGAKGKAMFDTAKQKLATESTAYDKSTNHGKNAGTVMDASIEDAEIAEEKKKEAEKKEAEKKSAEGVPAP